MNKTMNNKVRRGWIAGPLALIALGASAGVLYAQPDVNDAPKADNPPNWQNGPRGGRGGNDGNRPDFRNMTPEQRQQFQQQRQQEMQQRREQGLRRSLTSAGFTSNVVQDAIIAFANDQDKERDASQDKVRQLSQAIRDGAGDAEIATLLAAVRADAQAAQAKREAALKELDAKIGYTKSPKLEALLVLLGLTGEDITPGGRGGFGGPAMMGGFGGPGGFGGRGGQGGRGGRAQGNRPEDNRPDA